ncbi:aspartyl protease family protein At5g10770 [Oryza sativa Japonica Group]|nr:aspartyl protease family protein At5g10770 [Oryza sativa Japonica Group]EAY99437.1 hypothetical protein OsI_21406 [Oryza sativa Indica Group]KAF2924885.1 hypothetical protein DAI22_06g011400 [Oryza sativa Japonica Group]
MGKALDADQLRVAYIQKRLAGDTGDGADPHKFVEGGDTHVVSSLQVATGAGIGQKPHLTTTRLGTTATTNSAPDGTSAVSQTVIIDSGSDVPWVQCQPCPLLVCHPQRDPLFDPATSTTYAAVPCSSAACARLGPYRRGCLANSQCQFGITYANGATATGTYSSDDLTLGPYDVVRGFLFGCAHADQGSTFSYDVAGTLALGGGSQSFVQQTASQYSRVFSYCVPPSTSSFGFIMFGVPPQRAALVPTFVSTPLLSSSTMSPTFYRVLLRSIIVAGRPLPVPPTVFSASSVIDSATVISRIPPTAYQALRAAFRSAMTMYRPAPPVSILDTCYDFSGVRSITLPSIALVFDGGATVNLDAAGILLQGCLAFAPTASDRMPGFIGNVQQRTLEVVYDVPGKAIRFRSAAC